MSELAKVLRAAREQRGWTLRDAEEHSGVHNAHISQIENDRINRPSMALLWELSAAYDLDYAELLVLAGHATDKATERSARGLQGALLHATEELDEDDLKEALSFLKELRQRAGRERQASD